MLALYLNEIREDYNKKKFEEIYHLYEQKMYKIAYSILKQKEGAEDAVQDAFEVVLKKLDKIEVVDSKEAWNYILVIVRNKAIAIYRKNQGRKELVTDEFDLLDELKDEIQELEACILQKELSDVIASMILKLPERCQEVMYLHYYEERTYVEIGEIMGMTTENARQIARRGRKVLLEKMKAKGIEHE